MPVKRPPLESVILKGLNFESRCAIADAMAENVTEVERYLSRIHPVQHSGSQWSYISAYDSLQKLSTEHPNSRYSQAKLSP